MKELLTDNYSIQSYIDKNREKIDESLVSLRLMKEIDEFLDIRGISQREFALNLGCSEAYISQLMSGTKKINASFINKVEKRYGVEINFRIMTKEEGKSLSDLAGSSIQLTVNVLRVTSTEKVYSVDTKHHHFFNTESAQLVKLNGNEKQKGRY